MAILLAMTLKRAEWEKLVKEWRASRLTARQFAATRGVTDTALRYWANRLDDEADASRAQAQTTARATRSPGSSPVLARVVLPGAAPGDSGGRVMVMVGRASVVVEPGFDAGLLRDVVRALSEAG